MKTYSRKKVGDEEQEIIVDLNDVCRLCMGQEDELISIFSSEETVPITLRIMACVALEVFEGDGLPDKICAACKFQLEKSYNFRKKCELSDLKLRQHIRELKALDSDEHNEDGIMEIEESTGEENVSSDKTLSAEEDLVGVTKVTYIQEDPEPDEDPENITLPAESDNNDKEACTLQAVGLNIEQMKTEDDTENEEELENFIITDPEQNQIVTDNNMDVIADAVKATLASQTGLNLSGQLQFKINQSSHKPTQIEVTTEDGAVIVMELMTEDGNTDTAVAEPPSAKVNEDGELNIFQCPDCPKSFSRRIQLRRHTSVHMQQRGFSCGICEKWFPTRSALIRHERIHTGERPFQCEVCQKSFAQKEILFRHLMTHTGQKPYSCPHCDKGFSQKEPLKVHVRSHLIGGQADIQLHYCSLCPKVFCHASGLSRHLVTHTGKIFKCRGCDKCFTDKSSLRRHHIQTNHEM